MHLNAHASRNGLRFQSIYVAIVGVFCLASLVISFLTPKFGFEVGLQNSSQGSGLVVKRVLGEDEVRANDIIESVSGKRVNTKAEFYFQLLGSRGQVELVVRRHGERFIRPVTSESFSGGEVPLGLRSDDRAVMIAGADGHYTPLEGMDFSALRGIVAEFEGNGPVSVVFRRHEEVLSATVGVYPAVGRTCALSLVLLLFGVMLVVAVRSRHDAALESRARRVNLILGLGLVGVISVSLEALLLSIPLLFMMGIIGTTLFKAFDLDYHLSLRSLGRRVETWVRVTLYLGPAVTLVFPVFLCLLELPMLWGVSLSTEREMRLDTFFPLPMFWVMLYTVIDGGYTLLSWRRHRRRGSGFDWQPHHIGVLVACVIVFGAFFSFRSDMAATQWLVMSAIIVQSLGNVLELIKRRGFASESLIGSDIFSSKPICQALARAQDILGTQWLVQVVVDRPAPKHVVGLMVSEDAGSLTGLEINVLSQTWRDFIELFRIEGSVLLGGGQDGRNQDPVSGIAERLGIVMALPIAEHVGGALTNVVLLVSTRTEPTQAGALPDGPSLSQRLAMGEVTEQLLEGALAIVYLSSEMSLEYLGADLDALVGIHATASFARALRHPTLPMGAGELPHGLIDDEDETRGDVSDEIVVDNPEIGIDDCETKEYEEEVSFLRSQVQTLYSQQMRAFALFEIELTKAQSEALDALNALETPVLILGETGTGKHLLALASHQSRSQGPFLTIDAAEVPESIFALDIFGDDDNAGIIRGAAGGGLLIKNADKLPLSLLDDVLDAIESLPESEAVDLYMTASVSSDVSESCRHDALPAQYLEFAEHCGAGFVVVAPLRTQYDEAFVVDEFFMHKQAMRCSKSITSIDAQAKEALRAYAWPGNFVELRVVIERGVMRAQESSLLLSDLGRDFDSRGASEVETRHAAMRESEVYREQVQLMQALNEAQQVQIETLMRRIEGLEQAMAWKASDEASLLEGTFDEIEFRMLRQLLAKYEHNIDQAIEHLHIPRAQFVNMLGKYGLN